MLINVVAVAAYTRLLDPGRYGEFALAVAIAGLLSSFGVGWFLNGLVRFYARYQNDPDASRAYFSTVAIGYACASIVTLAVWSLIVLALGLDTIFLLSGLLFVGDSVFNLSIQLQRFDFKSGRYVVASIVRTGGAVALALALLAVTRDPSVILWALIFSSGVVGAWEFMAWARHHPLGIRFFSTAILREMVLFSFPLIASESARLGIRVTDRIVLAQLSGSIAVGLYSAAFVVTSGFEVVFMALSLALYPLVIEAAEAGNSAERDRLMRRTLQVALLLAIPLLVAVSLLSRPIADIFFGQDFLEAHEFIPWLGISSVLLGFTTIWPGWVLLIRQKTHLVWFTYPVALILNVGLNYLLIPLAGPVGAAYASAASAGVAFAISWLFARRYLTVPWPWGTATRVAAATLVMVGVLLAVPSSHIWLVVAEVVLGAAAYAGVLFVTKEEVMMEAIGRAGLIRTGSQ